jgi:AraC family transcriptional activator of pobA
MPDDSWIINEFKRSIRRNAESQVIELDNEFTYKFDFQIQRFEDVISVVGPTIPPNRWSYYRVGFLTQGSGEFITGMHRFTAKKNTLIVFPSRITTSSRNWHTDITGYILLFNLDFFLQNNFPHKYIENKRVLHGCLRPYIDVTPEEAAQLIAIFEAILQEKASNHKNKNEVIALKTIELLIKSERLFEEMQQIEDNLPTLEIIQRFSDLVDTNFATERSVAFYASQLNVHPNYLNALIKKNTGLTAKESIQNRLLLESKYLLHSTELTIKEISNQMGFTDPNYFAVFFKKYENTSPTSYRGSFV